MQEACNVMEEKQVRRLVVVDGGDTPVGVVSLGDIARCIFAASSRATC